MVAQFSTFFSFSIFLMLNHSQKKFHFDPDLDKKSLFGVITSVAKWYAKL